MCIYLAYTCVESIQKQLAGVAELSVPWKSFFGFSVLQEFVFLLLIPLITFSDILKIFRLSIIQAGGTIA